jgi:hypothetical protein
MAGVKNYVLVRGDADYDPVFLDGNALLKETAVRNAQTYSGAYKESKELEREISEHKQRLFDLNAQLAKLYNIPDSAENQMRREAIEHEIEQVEYYVGLRETALNRAENNYDLWRYWMDVQEKLGEPNKQKMMLCSPTEKVTGLARREMWVDDPTELEKDERTVQLEQQNESLQSQIDLLWQNYLDSFDPNTGTPTQSKEEVEAQVRSLNAQISRNNQTLESYYKATLDAYYSHLSETGRLAMAEHSVTTSFDGDVASNVQYLYGRDYFLGDLVQIRNDYGMEAVTRVTEVMRSRDEAGDYVIPTFVSDGGSNGT